MDAMQASLVYRMRVRFEGSLPVREYVSSDVRNEAPGWGDELFNRGIESIEFFLPAGHKLLLSGMEKYAFFVECTHSIGQDRPKIEGLWFCGKLPGQSVSDLWRITQGRITHVRHPFGKEWGGAPIRGWKLGIVGDQPFSGIV